MKCNFDTVIDLNWINTETTTHLIMTLFSSVELLCVSRRLSLPWPVLLSNTCTHVNLQHTNTPEACRRVQVDGCVWLVQAMIGINCHGRRHACLSHEVNSDWPDESRSCFRRSRSPRASCPEFTPPQHTPPVRSADGSVETRHKRPPRIRWRMQDFWCRQMVSITASVCFVFTERNQSNCATSVGEKDSVSGLISRGCLCYVNFLPSDSLLLFVDDDSAE